jgi:hypothetical protein
MRTSEETTGRRGGQTPNPRKTAAGARGTLGEQCLGSQQGFVVSRGSALGRGQGRARRRGWLGRGCSREAGPRSVERHASPSRCDRAVEHPARRPQALAVAFVEWRDLAATLSARFNRRWASAMETCHPRAKQGSAWAWGRCSSPNESGLRCWIRPTGEALLRSIGWPRVESS